MTTNSSEHRSDITIIGAGIAGLACAFFARQRGFSVEILEPSDRPGGVIKSECRNGFLLEFGPNTVLPTNELMDMVEGLDLSSHLLLAHPKIPRYIRMSGQLHEVPMSLKALFKTKLVNFPSVLRLLREPLIPARTSSKEESLESFALRRLGRTVYERLLSPYVSGVWAGNPAELSAEGAFPRLVQWEKEYGSLLWGAIKGRKSEKKTGTKVPKGLMSFKNGLETLPIKLAHSFAGHLHLNSERIDITPPIGTTSWTISTSQGRFNSTSLILALPAYDAASLISSFASQAATALKAIPYAPLAAYHCSIEKSALKHDLNGFGYLVAPSEKSEILGCLWNSSLFEGRAPQSHHLMTVFMGGASHLDMLKKSDERLIQSANETLRQHLPLLKDPALISFLRYEQSIPQYTLGHRERQKKISEMEKTWKGLRCAGNYREGISVGDVVKYSKKVIESLSS